LGGEGGSLFWSGYEWFGEKTDFGISDELSRNQVLSQARTENDKNNKPIASKTKLWRIERLNFPHYGPLYSGLHMPQLKTKSYQPKLNEKMGP
jgi:hypothetical protein